MNILRKKEESLLGITYLHAKHQRIRFRISCHKRTDGMISQNNSDLHEGGFNPSGSILD